MRRISPAHRAKNIPFRDGSDSGAEHLPLIETGPAAVNEWVKDWFSIILFISQQSLEVYTYLRNTKMTEKEETISLIYIEEEKNTGLVDILALCEIFVNIELLSE